MVFYTWNNILPGEWHSWGRLAIFSAAHREGEAVGECPRPVRLFWWKAQEVFVEAT